MSQTTYTRLLTMIIIVTLVFSINGCGRRPQDVGSPPGSDSTRFPSSYPNSKYGPPWPNKETITDHHDNDVAQ